MAGQALSSHNVAIVPFNVDAACEASKKAVSPPMPNLGEYVIISCFLARRGPARSLKT